MDGSFFYFLIAHVSSLNGKQSCLFFFFKKAVFLCYWLTKYVILKSAINSIFSFAITTLLWLKGGASPLGEGMQSQ